MDNDGYVRTTIKEKAIFLHKISKEVPEGYVVDHINRVRTDNRNENLRIITRNQNMQNIGGNNRSITGVRGVSICKRWGKTKYRARVTVNKKEVSLGRYDTLEEAEKVVKEARKRLLPYSVE